ncbi:MAG: hypothetical protein WBP55_05835 [Solirubrobacterales bacterium]
MAALAAAGLAGCGDSDTSPVTGGSEADQAAVIAANNRVNQLVKDNDAAAFCAEFAPSQVKDTFGTVKKCVKQTRPFMEATAKSQDFTIESMTITGDHATVTYADGQGIGTFTKEDGRWYIGAPSAE